jgi:predicted nucleic acid-binding protein
MIVLDASAVVELLLSTPTGRNVADRLKALPTPAHVPHLLAVEVTHALRRLAATTAITSTEAHEALVVLGQLDLQRWDHEPMLRRAWQLRDNLTIYDAMYVVLAEALDAPLLTIDRRLGRSIGHHARIEVLTAA